MLAKGWSQLRDWFLPIDYRAVAAMNSLLQRIAAGDDSAVESVVSEYGDLVWRIAVRRLGRDHLELDDAVQNAFVDVWRHASRYDPARGSEAAFIGIIAAHRAIDILRQSPSVPSKIDAAELDRSAHRSAHSPEHSADPDLARVFSGLREEQQDALRLRYHAGMSYDQIAVVFESKPATIRSRVFQGLRRLRAGVSSAARPEYVQAAREDEGQHNG